MAEKWKIAIIGKGNVGSALQRGLKRAGYEVRAAGKGEALRDTAGWGEVVILAVPYGQIDAALSELGGAIDGKTLIDVTNPLTADLQLGVDCTTSGAEQLQKKARGAKVVKAFNMLFAAHMDSGRLKGRRLTALAAGDDPEAKGRALQIAQDIGFDAVDAGPLRNARLLESLAVLNVQLGYALGMGDQIGFSLIH